MNTPNRKSKWDSPCPDFSLGYVIEYPSGVTWWFTACAVHSPGHFTIVTCRWTVPMFIDNLFLDHIQVFFLPSDFFPAMIFMGIWQYIHPWEEQQVHNYYHHFYIWLHFANEKQWAWKKIAPLMNWKSVFLSCSLPACFQESV